MDAQKVLEWMAEEDRTLAYLARQSGVSVDRLVAAVAEQHDEWAGGRRYLTANDDLDADTLPAGNVLEAAA